MTQLNLLLDPDWSYTLWKGERGHEIRGDQITADMLDGVTRIEPSGVHDNALEQAKVRMTKAHAALLEAKAKRVAGEVPLFGLDLSPIKDRLAAIESKVDKLPDDWLEQMVASGKTATLDQEPATFDEEWIYRVHLGSGGWASYTGEDLNRFGAPEGAVRYERLRTCDSSPAANGDGAGIVPRPSVAWFAGHMELVLRSHDQQKGGQESWRRTAQTHLLSRLRGEVCELSGAVRTHHLAASDGKQESKTYRVVREAADVANFAMMIADSVAREVEDANVSHPIGQSDGRTGVTE